jgi:5-methylcytosine-specific restriction endonuclease McrA
LLTTLHHSVSVANYWTPRIVNRFAIDVIEPKLRKILVSGRKCTACGKDIGNQPRGYTTCGGACRFETIRRRQEWRNCEWCGIRFRRRKRGKDAKRFCNRQCGWAFQNRGKFSYCEWKPCAACGLPFQARKPELCFCSSECGKYPALPRFCPNCRIVIGKSAQRCDVCRKAKADLIRQSDRYKAQRKRTKVTRRARTRGVIRATIGLVEVLKRCGRECYICGCVTDPYSTHNGESATLDHVVPLALGGWHDMVNLRIACRNCNSLKGAKYTGQLMLTYS